MQHRVRRHGRPGPAAPPTDDPAALKAELGRLREENRRLAMEREILKSDGLLRRREGLRFESIRDHRDEFPVALMCDVLEVSRAGHYARLARPESPRAARMAELSRSVAEAHGASRGTSGAPRVRKAPEAGGWPAARTRWPS
jgi:hypothetical protein